MYRSITGTFDILPDAYRIDRDEIPAARTWTHVERVIREVMGRFGAEEIRTPILEPTELIARGVGQLTDIVSKEMFAFERGDTHYVMRPEITAPVMRSYLQHSLAQRGGTQRLFYIGPCFRAERPQRGRYRQFHQFGVELIGAAGPQADVEVIAMMVAVYEQLGVTNRSLRINSLGEADARASYRDALRTYLAPFASRLSETSRQRIEVNPLRILDTKDRDERALLVDAPRLSDFLDDASREHHEQVKVLLADRGITFTEDPFLVRGLDYYTRTAFELESPSLGSQSALGGGGRYDLLAQELGSKNPVPAVGFAAGLERLFMAMAAEASTLPEAPGVDLFIVALGDEAGRWAARTAHGLRHSGRSVVIDLLGRSMKAQMREANRSGARQVLIVGSDELASGSATLRDLGTGDQQTVAFDQLAEQLSP